MATHHPDLVFAGGSPTRAAAVTRATSLSRVQFLLLAFVIASFAYEIPLVYISNFYTANPYLFDVASSVLIAYWVVAGRNQGWNLSIRNNLMLPPWTFMTAVFVWATLVSGTWVPFGHYLKTIWYCGMYLQGLLTLMIFFAAPISARDKRRLLWVAVMAGTWVSVFAILQFAGILSTARVIPKGWEVAVEGTGIYSTLGPSYFHAGFFGVLSATVGVAAFQSSRGFARVVAAILAPLCAVPAIIAGTRSAFIALMIALAAMALRPRNLRRGTTWIMAGILALSISWFWQRSYTKERTDTRPLQASVNVRTVGVFGLMETEIREHGVLLLLAGGGFGVVPVAGKFRTGYGIHNIHLYPLEQAGLAAFFGALYMWGRYGWLLGRRRHPWPMNAMDENLRSSTLAYLAAIVIVGWSGTSFYVRSGTEHFTFYTLLIIGLALVPTGGQTGEAPVPEPGPTGAWFDPEPPAVEPAPATRD